MRAEGTAGLLGKDPIERLLREVLVPVEPDARFIHHLRARLVHLRGSGVSSNLLTVGFLVLVFLFLMASMGIALRVVLAVLGLLGLIQRRRRARRGSAVRS